MKFRATLRDSPEINLTALIDVVFLLLIFFMVSTTFEWRTELSIELPQASAQEIARDDAVVDVVIDSGGSVHVEGRRLDDPATGILRHALASAARDSTRPRWSSAPTGKRPTSRSSRSWTLHVRRACTG